MTKMKGGPADTGGPVEVPEQLSILPLRNSVLFPGSIIPIDVGRRKSVRLVEEAISKERPVIGILTQRDARTEDPAAGDLYLVGCAARILKVIKLAKDNFSVILQGVSRIRGRRRIDSSEPFLTAQVQQRSPIRRRRRRARRARDEPADIAKQVIQLMPELPRRPARSSTRHRRRARSPISSRRTSTLRSTRRRTLLETVDVKERIRKVLQFLTRQLEILKMRERINSQIKEEMGKNQREYVLRQQLKAIKEELGERRRPAAISTASRSASPKAKLPARRPRQVAKKQLKRLRSDAGRSRRVHGRPHLPRLDPRPAVARPDRRTTSTSRAVRKVLDEDHYGLEKVKKRILEYLAVRKLKKRQEGPDPVPHRPARRRQDVARPLASRARSGASSRRISLGGVHDEAAIRGHRRTYVGALPGQIIQGMKKAGTDQPGLHARRGRQDRARLPRRPGGGAARGARPRAEQHVRRSLPRDPVRPLERHVRRDGEHRRPDPARRSATAWRSSRSPATRGDEKLAIARQHLVPEAARGARPHQRAARHHRRGGRSRSSTATRARPAFAPSSARSPASSAASP